MGERYRGESLPYSGYSGKNKNFEETCGALNVFKYVKSEVRIG